MSLFLCLNCLSSNRTTKNSIQSQKAKTGIWQQFKKFFVGIKNLKTYIKSVVSGNGAYSKETGKSMAGLALNTLTVESRSKESLNLISNSENKFYVKAAKECKKKDEGYLKAIQTATNPEFLNAKEKSVKDNSTRGTHHTSIQSGDNHTLVPNPSSSVSSNAAVDPTIGAKTISDSSEVPKNVVTTLNGKNKKLQTESKSLDKNFLEKLFTEYYGKRALRRHHFLLMSKKQQYGFTVVPHTLQ
ncbi:hypothetical protein CJJ19_10270 [Candidatus Williamhamiltonella defendens]|nr:hypothetical protein [Candidatus Hamiltonella defensa]AYB49746.1 hypothetical protein CJJ19_10270 [Candidatus Hamiltonella defensa]